MDLFELKLFNSRKFQFRIFWTFWSNRLTDTWPTFLGWISQEVSVSIKLTELSSVSRHWSSVNRQSTEPPEQAYLGSHPALWNWNRWVTEPNSVNRHCDLGRQTPGRRGDRVSLRKMLGFVSVNRAFGKPTDSVRSAESQSSVNRQVTDVVKVLEFIFDIFLNLHGC